MADNSSSSSSSSAGATLAGADRKIIDLHLAADYAQLANASAELQANAITGGILRGDFLLLRWTIFQNEGDPDTPFQIKVADGLEFIVTNAVNATVSEVMAYSDNDQFNPSDWTGFDRGGGKVSVRVDMDAYALTDDIDSETTKTYNAALYLTPSGTAEHVCLWVGTIELRNDIYREGQGGSPIILNPPSEAVMSSSSSSSTLAGNTSSSSTSVSSSSTSSTSESSAASSTSLSSSSQSSTSESTLRDQSSSLSSQSTSSTVAGNTSSSSQSSSTTSVSSTSESSAASSTSVSSSSTSSTSEST